MSSTLLEVTRATHEDTEQLERRIVKVLKNEQPTFNKKQRLSQMHHVRYMIDQIIYATHKLVDIYEDKDNARKDEIASLSDRQKFHDQLKEILVYHRGFPSTRVIDNGTHDEYEHLLKEEQLSGEEASGSYLDMHALHKEYIKSKLGKQIDYASFLEEFPLLQHIPIKIKSTMWYKEYLSNLLDYLVSFIKRAHPLQDVERLFLEVAREFNEQWAKRKVEAGRPFHQQHALIDTDCYTSAAELVELGPEMLREALGVLGLKTGGTVQDCAKRLFLTKDTPLEKLDKKHFVKDGDSKETALVEAKIMKLCEILSETIMRTKENAKRKQGLTYEEMVVEREDDEDVVEVGSDDESLSKYNPLNLPMGWDGKPIPYWLSKLHGLDKVFKCEICGDHSYRGRRAYERHFREFQHQHGMRRLGIPNNKNFNEITSIEEAQRLWENIKEKQEVKRWRPELEEEFEDQEGNIYNKKVYSDLKRQRLI
ncbi:splicing factor SF3a60 [Artemisia annua]|uniref:Splicing factor SF3a60 n=1 Tax=Artemisia annua TaxID=35608 RepID=A0A2U1PWS1_ARTAN|nr:splicing factor SF3a60 [Artemisia annua]